MPQLRIGPLSGIFAFGGVILCTIASLGILAGSNHSPVTSWPTPPSTFIAIFTAISNIMMRYAAVQGIVVAWWIKALHGSSVSELHYNWRAGASFHGALMAGRHMGWIGVASILSCIVIVIDGPLLQRSSTVTTASHTGPTIDLHFTMVPEMPTGTLSITTSFLVHLITIAARKKSYFTDTSVQITLEVGYPATARCAGVQLSTAPYHLLAVPFLTPSMLADRTFWPKSFQHGPLTSPSQTVSPAALINAQLDLSHRLSLPLLALRKSSRLIIQLLTTSTLHWERSMLLL